MGEIGRPLRPIAPRSAFPGGAGDAGGGQLPGGNSGGTPSDDGRMKRASTACKECQKRRTRCTGGPGVPCTECLAHNRECIFDELADRRRKASARRTQEELERTQEVLGRTQEELERTQEMLTGAREFTEQLLSVFRVGDNAEVQHLINTIRSGASLLNIHTTTLQLHASPNIRYHNQSGSMSPLDWSQIQFNPR